MIPRRTVLGAACALPLVGCGVREIDPHPASERPIRRIAFGSCAHQDREQPIWDAVLAAEPDLFVFLGDNVYGDTRDMDVLEAKYAQLAAKPGFRKLRETVAIAAIWDDHDYGENDAGEEYPLKEASKRLFLDFWGEADSPRAARDGICASYRFGPRGQRVQLVLPDLRWNRTPLRKADLGVPYDEWAARRRALGLPVAGPYARNAGAGATMLGEAQWSWLERVLSTPADLRLFGSSLQVLADFSGWEGWANFVDDQQRLLDLLRRTEADGVLFLSGDIHYGELSRVPWGGRTPLLDLTSSGLTEDWRIPVPNDRRISPVIPGPNFGLITVDWEDGALDLELRDVVGEVRFAHRALLGELRG